jgi:GT2 family glycosyltransferase
VTDAPRVAAVIVHYGDPAPTRRCLDALDGIDEIVLVDQPPRLHGPHHRVTTRIVAATNLGFAAACNRGVAATDAPFVLLLNNDAVLAPGSAAALTAALPGLGSEVAGACLKLLCMDGLTLQSAGGLWFTRDGIGFPRGFGQADHGQYDGIAAGEVGVPSGAAALYRTCAWREAGGMSEEFFCYCEDGDLGLRMVAAGGHFAWLPGVVVRHELSASSGAHSRFKAFHVERNHFAAMVHSAPLPLVVALPVVTVARIATVALDAARGRGVGAAMTHESSPLSLATTLVRAWVEAARMVPGALARRRTLLREHPQALRRVGDFLASRHVPLSVFARSRDASATGQP